MTKFATMPASRIGGAVKLLLLFAVQIGFVVVFHLLGSIDDLSINFSNLSVWLEQTSPEIALIASVRLLALAFSYWMLGTSLIYMIARSFHITAVVRALEFTTLPGVRKIIDAGLAATIIGGTVFGGAAAVFAKQADTKVASPAAASRVLFNPNASAAGSNTALPLVNPHASPSDKSVPIIGSSSNLSNPAKKVVLPSQTSDDTQTQETHDGPRKNEDGNYIPTPAEKYVPPSVEDGEVPTPAQTNSSPKVVLPDTEQTTTTAPKITLPPTTAPITSEPDVQVGGEQVTRDDVQEDGDISSSTSYTVVSGDNFWKIARQQIRNVTGSEPSNAEIANYWVRLIDANRDTIRSGDPDLIFPGEVFTLPPV